MLRISPVEVRRGRQRSDSRRLRSGEAHCDRELAAEVWQGSLRSSAGRRGPATTTAIKSRCGGRKDARKKTRRSRASDIESNNPHLAGGGKNDII